MNHIRQLRRKAGLDMIELADLSHVDVAEIALAENDIGHVNIETARAICRSLNASLSSLFPDVRDILDALPDATDEEMRAAILAPDTAKALLAAGLDPDDTRWYAVVRTKSGNEMKYLLSSPEMRFLAETLQDPQRTFVRFSSDCRHIVLRIAALADVRFTTVTSYAPFSSRESAWEVMVYWGNGARPERVDVATDVAPSDACERMLSGRGEDVPAFLGLASDEGDHRFISMDAIDALEIPVGVVHPGLYLEQRSARPTAASDDLAELAALGTA